MAGEPETECRERCCKVTATALEYDVMDTAMRLPERRHAGDSLRELTRWFNISVIDQILGNSDISSGKSIHTALIGDDLAEEVYRILRTDDGTDVQRAELRARLAEAGIDVDALENALVSHVTIRAHLLECLNIDVDTQVANFEKTTNTIRWAHSRAENVIQSALESSVAAGETRTGPLQAEVAVRVTCQTCGDMFYVDEFLENPQCQCAGEDNYEQS